MRTFTPKAVAPFSAPNTITVSGEVAGVAHNENIVENAALLKRYRDIERRQKDAQSTRTAARLAAKNVHDTALETAATTRNAALESTTDEAERRSVVEAFENAQIQALEVRQAAEKVADDTFNEVSGVIQADRQKLDAGAFDLAVKQFTEREPEPIEE